MSKATTPSPFRFIEGDTTPKNIYVDKALMRQALIVYQDSLKSTLEAGLPEPEMSNELGGYILAIATNMAHRHNFRRYTFTTEMISDAVILGLRLAKTFDVTHPSANPFSYFSFSFFRSFVNNIVYENEQLEKKYDYILQLEIDIASYQEHDKDNHNNQYISYLQEYVDEARTFKEKRKEKETTEEQKFEEAEIGLSIPAAIKRAYKPSKYVSLGF